MVVPMVLSGNTNAWSCRPSLVATRYSTPVEAPSNSLRRRARLACVTIRAPCAFRIDHRRPLSEISLTGTGTNVDFTWKTA